MSFIAFNRLIFSNDDGEDHDFGNEHFNAHRTWLTANQKRHLKRMREKGHEDHEIHDKINEFHETSPEEVKVRGCDFSEGDTVDYSCFYRIYPNFNKNKYSENSTRHP